MNAGYYKLAKHIGCKCHQDLAAYFDGKSDKFMFDVSRNVAGLYQKRSAGWYLRCERMLYKVEKNDLRLRRNVIINGMRDTLHGQIDQVLVRQNRRFILDYKFTRKDTPTEAAADQVRQQIAYYAWLLNDPYCIGGIYIIANMDTNDILEVRQFCFEEGEPKRALMRLLNDLPGYENVNYENIEVRP